LVRAQYGVNVILNFSTALNNQFTINCTYLTTQNVQHFKHTSHASKLLLKRSTEMEISRHEIKCIGVRWYIIYRP